MTPIVRKKRCAIYTRKSTEEGLEMDYNSLDAQRDACHAYIASQKSEGCRHARVREQSPADRREIWTCYAAIR
jgi:DNA invertase Pin-like site-specific DNA recombinase